MRFSYANQIANHYFNLNTLIFIKIYLHKDYALKSPFGFLFSFELEPVLRLFLVLQTER